MLTRKTLPAREAGLIDGMMSSLLYVSVYDE